MAHALETTSKRVAIVTGGTRGIGLAISKALAADGVSVAAIYRSDARSAEAARAELAAAGADSLVLQADLSRQADAAAAVEAVAKRWERIDILVNNAGVFEFSLFEEMSEKFFDSIFTSNFKSMFYLIKSALPWLKISDHGRIVNASSISGRLADVGLIAYGCSKASVDMMTRIAAAELAPYRITVNAFAPGIIATEMTREMIEERGSEQVKQIPLGRFGTPEDTASLVRFLCSPAADYITGEVIGVDGGMLKVQNPFRAVRRP